MNVVDCSVSTVETTIVLDYSSKGIYLTNLLILMRIVVPRTVGLSHPRSGGQVLMAECEQFFFLLVLRCQELSFWKSFYQDTKEKGISCCAENAEVQNLLSENKFLIPEWLQSSFTLTGLALISGLSRPCFFPHISSLDTKLGNSESYLGAQFLGLAKISTLAVWASWLTSLQKWSEWEEKGAVTKSKKNPTSESQERTLFQRGAE